MGTKKTVFIVACFGLCLAGLAAEAGTLPNFANGGQDLKTSMESTGKNIVDTILAAVAVMAIISMAIGIFMIAAAKGENGKLYLYSGGAGLFGSGVLYGIAKLVV